MPPLSSALARSTPGRRHGASTSRPRVRWRAGWPERAYAQPTCCGRRCLAGGRDEYRLAERVGNRVLAVIGPLMAGPAAQVQGGAHENRRSRDAGVRRAGSPGGAHRRIRCHPGARRLAVAPWSAAPLRTISGLSLTMAHDGFPATPAKESNFKQLRDTVQSFPLSSRRLAVGGQASVRRSAR